MTDLFIFGAGVLVGWAAGALIGVIAGLVLGIVGMFLYVMAKPKG